MPAFLLYPQYFNPACKSCKVFCKREHADSGPLRSSKVSRLVHSAPSPAEPKMWRIRKQGMKMARCPKIVTDSNLKVAGENSSTEGGMSRRKTLGELWLKALGMLLHTGMAKFGLCCLSVVSRAKAGVTPIKNKLTSFCDCHLQNSSLIS